MRVSELTGVALDWAVAKCETERCGNKFNPQCDLKGGFDGIGNEYPAYCPSTSWEQAGPIIEREKIGLVYYPDMNCMTHEVLPKWIGSNVVHSATGKTPLIAAMRCYVASKLGEDVDIPEELL